MIISCLYGGLGNQLFQYAAGRSLAAKHQTSLHLDVSMFGKEPLRRYVLDHFLIRATILSDAERMSLGLPSGQDGRLRRVVQRLAGLSAAPMIEERDYGFSPDVLDAPSFCCLRGYFQSPRYFEMIEEQIRLELVVSDALVGRNREIATQVGATTAVAVHVRRGDYATNAHTNKYHGTCGPDYYALAEKLLREKLVEPHLFVFSDDPDWAEENLHFVSPATFLRHNDPKHDYEDLRLMSLCRHHIIANSTFSWWGAWLCVHPDKIVVAPRNWFGEAGLSTSDLIPRSWIQI